MFLHTSSWVEWAFERNWLDFLVGPYKDKFHSLVDFQLTIISQYHCFLPKLYSYFIFETNTPYFWMKILIKKYPHNIPVHFTAYCQQGRSKCVPCRFEWRHCVYRSLFDDFREWVKLYLKNSAVPILETLYYLYNRTKSSI